RARLACQAQLSAFAPLRGVHLLGQLFSAGHSSVVGAERTGTRGDPDVCLC
ncbi:unnamed protein product, partial [Symbiodinium sp. CCMP2456]